MLCDKLWNFCCEISIMKIKKKIYFTCKSDIVHLKLPPLFDLICLVSTYNYFWLNYFPYKIEAREARGEAAGNISVIWKIKLNTIFNKLKHKSNKKSILFSARTLLISPVMLIVEKIIFSLVKMSFLW